LVAVPTVTAANDVCPVPPLATARAVPSVIEVADAAPKTGVTNVGDVDSTFEPVPVLATEIKFLEESVAKALDAVKPDNCKLVPVATPKTGVTNVGDVDSTFEPEPVLVVTPVPPLVTANDVPSVRLVADAAPKIGVTNVGEVASTLFPVPVLATEIKFFDASVAKALDAVKPDSNKLVPVAAPILGVTNVGDVFSTFEPEPVLVVTPVPPLATAMVVAFHVPVVRVPTAVICV
jgi:hypothetical protein